MHSREPVAALSRALTPPAGDADAFEALGLPRPDRDALELEHGTLFGRTGPARVSPYSSGGGAGTDLHAVLAAYSAAGFEPDPEFRDRADHVCAQFALLAALIAEERTARSAGRHERAEWIAEQRRSFLSGRFRPFTVALLEGMRGETDFPLHRALARRAAEILEEVGLDMRAAPPRRPTTDESTATCAECGSLLGTPRLPTTAPRPLWAATCARCRMRNDLRRTTR